MKKKIIATVIVIGLVLGMFGISSAQPLNEAVETEQGTVQADGVEPVSYTHLDVYKRQVSFLRMPQSIAGFFCTGCENADFAVGSFLEMGGDFPVRVEW